MGTTVVAARIPRAAGAMTRFEVAWVGDSRVYLWRDGPLAQLSQDHSYVQDLLARRALSVQQARRHPHRNVLTPTLGVTHPPQMNVATMNNGSSSCRERG